MSSDTGTHAEPFYFGSSNQRADGTLTGCGTSTAIPEAFLLVHLVLGSVLLSAASFKAHALWTDPLPNVSWFASPRWQFAFITIESLLGLWLVLGFYAIGAWKAAALAFTFFSATSFYLSVTGVPSCGCFGRLSISPWYVLALDALALTALWVWRPRPGSTWELVNVGSGGTIRAAICVFGAATVILACIVGLLYVLELSPLSLLAAIRGESVTVEPSVSDLGIGRAGERHELEIKVNNNTDRSIRILGATTTCSCKINGLPIALPPNGTSRISISANFTGRSGLTLQAFHLFTDDDVQPRVLVRYRRYLETTPEK